MPSPPMSKGCFPSPISNFESPLSIIHLKLVSTIFYQIFIFSQTDSPLKTKKMVFISVTAYNKQGISNESTQRINCVASEVYTIWS